MFHVPRPSRLLAITLLALLTPIGAAHAAHFKFVAMFQQGPLSGTTWVGFISTDSNTGEFSPNAHDGGQLMSFAITIAGAKFTMYDDKYFPELPLFSVENSGFASRLYLNMSAGSATALHDKRLNIDFDTVNGAKGIEFGKVGDNQFEGDSFGVISAIQRFEPRLVQPRPECSACHTQPPMR